MKKWTRAKYQPPIPMGENGKRVTGSQEHIQLSRQIASSCMVLMKNEQQLLPFAKGTKLAVFGKAGMDYVKGGGGSGDVTVAYVRSLVEGLRIKQSEHKIMLFEPLNAYYEKHVQAEYAKNVIPGQVSEPEVPSGLVEQARAFTDTALITICRYSGEDWDRPFSDYFLNEQEKKLIDTVAAAFPKVAVTLNTGSQTDAVWFKQDDRVQSVLLIGQTGMEGGLAAADLLVGDETPSGHIVDTYAYTLEDYPSTASILESKEFVHYTEDIYVGYRYFHTIPGMEQKVCYPFGYGLSYTTFDVQTEKVVIDGMKATLTVRVLNTGKYAGREVVQVYLQAPQGKLGKADKVLCAFAKTRKLQCGECQIMTINCDLADFASYDDLGKVQKSAYVLEAGAYSFWIGENVADCTKADVDCVLEQDVITLQLSAKCVPSQLPKRMLSDGTFEELPMLDDPRDPMSDYMPMTHVKEHECIVPQDKFRDYTCWLTDPRDGGKILLEDVADGRATLDQFIAQLSDRDLAELLGGQQNLGVANTFGIGNLPEYGVPNIMTADGPAGLRIKPECEVTTTAWPCASMIACSWDEKAARMIGEAAAMEVMENNIAIWLAPAINIHRNPLCGRNFEYYSEDPYLTGKMASAMIAGMQSMGIGASLKHFCCNNKENNRKFSDSRLSERALREIYLKGFEICVKESQPWTIMSSYNLVNGTGSSCNKELLTDILRGEWDFKGLVTTDWWTFREHWIEVKAGNDLKMGCGYPDQLMQALDKGLMSREDMAICARRVLELILKVD